MSMRTIHEAAAAIRERRLSPVDLLARQEPATRTGTVLSLIRFGAFCTIQDDKGKFAKRKRMNWGSTRVPRVLCGRTPNNSPRGDPVRYANLSHPGDSYSYDIFSQAGQAIRDNAPTILGGLKPKHIIAIGPRRQDFDD